MLDRYTNLFFSFGFGVILMWLTESSEAHVNYTAKPRVVLPPNYVKEIRPPSKKGSPVIVDFSIFVVDINSINVEDMDFRVDMFIHQRWLESRLEISDDIFEEGDDYVTLLPEFFDNLWQPDPYFLNSKIAGFGSPYVASSSLLRDKHEREKKNFHLDKTLSIQTTILLLNYPATAKSFYIPPPAINQSINQSIKCSSPILSNASKCTVSPSILYQCSKEMRPKTQNYSVTAKIAEYRKQTLNCFILHFCGRRQLSESLSFPKFTAS